MLYKYLIISLLVPLAVYSAAHALLNKKDSRAAFGWIVACLFIPLIGPILYFIFGINRLRTRARKLTFPQVEGNEFILDLSKNTSLENRVPDTLKNLQKVSSRLTKLPLLAAKEIEILFSGEQTYPSMLDAINSAKGYIYLCVYIFKNDAIGNIFIQALVNAKNRGVNVYVLIDGVGEYYFFKKVRTELKNNNIPVRRFLPPTLYPLNFYVNLRNHRKLLIVDDVISYVGGMNISADYARDKQLDKESLVDIHFKITGGVTCQLKKIFESDWYFAGGKISSTGIENSTNLEDRIICRTIINGPGENIGHLSIILLTAINSAVSKISLMTPYFIPHRELIGALVSAALRGVKINIILPEKSNLRYVDWASRNMLWELLEKDINIYYQPQPFAHSKLFVIDDQYSIIGSANIDPRSLRLNYEVGVEVYDNGFASQLNKYIQNILLISKLVSLEDVDGRRLPVRIRDGIVWLFSPYL